MTTFTSENSSHPGNTGQALLLKWTLSLMPRFAFQIIMYMWLWGYLIHRCSGLYT